MNQNKYAKKLGRIVANMHGLEFAIRAFLFHSETTFLGLPQLNINYNKLKVGDCVDYNAFTNYYTLGKLVDEYNTFVRKHIQSSMNYILDKSVVDLRDAIAHGRISSNNPDEDYCLLKFGKKENGKTKVTFFARMDENWFRIQNNLLANQIRKIISAAEYLEMNVIADVNI